MKAINTRTGAALTLREINEHRKLSRLWATGKATKHQILRCMELDRRADYNPDADADALAAAELSGRY